MMPDSLYSSYTCTHCRTVVNANDAESPTDTGYCLCRWCFARMREEPKIPLTHRVYMDLNDAVNDSEAGRYTVPQGSDWDAYEYTKRDLEPPAADEMPE